MYVPVLRFKQGEIKAIEKLSDTVKSHVTPIFFTGEGNEIPLQKQIEFFVNHWGLPAYYEREVYKEDDDYSSLISHEQLDIIPVYSDYNSNDCELISNLVRIKGHCCLRISCSDINEEFLVAKLNEMMSLIHTSFEMTDVVLDFETIESNRVHSHAIYARSLVQAVTEMGQWNKIIYLASSLPQGVSEYDKFRLIEIPHDEWTIWEMLTRSYPRLAYGDYASVSADFDYDGDLTLLRPAAKIRYLCDNCWLLVRGEQLKKGYEQFRRLSNIIKSDLRFSLPVRCYADEFIEQCANGGRTGNLTTWVTVAVNRHLTFVVAQLSNQFDS